MSRTKIVALLLLCFVAFSTFARAETKHDQFWRPRVITPIAEVDLFDVLRRTYKLSFGEDPSDKVLASGWAQVALENGRGKFTYDHNLGNIGTMKRVVPYFFMEGHRYTSFDDFDDAGIAYWAVIKRCKAGFEAFKHGDPRSAAKYLRWCGYYGADLEAYQNGMEKLYYCALKKIKSEKSP